MRLTFDIGKVSTVINILIPDQVCREEEVEKCRWVVRNENKQVEEKVCNFIDKKVSFVTFDYV